MTTPLEALKLHMNIPAGDTADDALLAQNLNEATAWVADVIGKPVEADAPASIHRAVRMMAAHFYENREATIVGVSAAETPFGVMSLLDSHRYWPGQGA